MQTVAEAWLVLRLTGSGVALGIAAALQFLPILVGGAWGGLLADRLPKRRLLMTTQSLMLLPPLTLFTLAASGHATLGVVYALIFARGAINAVDNPARQSFISEIVGSDQVVNAVALNAVMVQFARIAGPALAAAIISVWGVEPCFLVNALSFGAMLFALTRMDARELMPARPAVRGRGQLRDALRIVRASPELRTPLLLMAVVGTLAFNFTTTLPLLARFTFHGGASTYALLTATMAFGAVFGALVSSARADISTRLLGVAALAFGAGLAAVALAPSLPIALIALVPVGAASVTFTASTNASLQLAADPSLRGRVMALYAVVFLGSTPIGAPMIGWLSEAAGPRAGLGVGALAAVAAGTWVLLRAAPAVRARPALAER